MSKAIATKTPSKMKIISFPVKDIIIGPRQRIDLGDVAGLAESIKDNGQIQAIGITEDNRLIWGRRRLEAHIILGMTHINVIQRTGLSPLDEQMLEWEEDFRQKPRGWKEKCIALASMFQHMKNVKEANGEKWTMKTMAEFTGLGGPVNINYMLRVAESIKAEPEGVVAKADGLTNAIKFLLEMERTKSVSELERRRALTTAAQNAAARPPIVPNDEYTESQPIGDLLLLESDSVTEPDRIPIWAASSLSEKLPACRVAILHSYDSAAEVCEVIKYLPNDAVGVCFIDPAFHQTFVSGIASFNHSTQSHPLIWYIPNENRGNTLFGLDYKLGIVFAKQEAVQTAETPASSVIIAPSTPDGYLPLQAVSHILEATTLSGASVLCLGRVNPVDIAYCGRTPVIVDDNDTQRANKIEALKNYYRSNNPTCEFIV